MLITARQWSCQKVMFSVTSVCLPSERSLYVTITHDTIRQSLVMWGLTSPPDSYPAPCSHHTGILAPDMFKLVHSPNCPQVAFDWIPSCYHLQMKFAKVMFSHVSFCPQGELSASGPRGCARQPPRQTSPRADTPLCSACWDMVNKWVVCTPLECILVLTNFHSTTYIFMQTISDDSNLNRAYFVNLATELKVLLYGKYKEMYSN